MNRVWKYSVATFPALAVLGFFVWFANWIPQTRWEPPQKQAITVGMAPAQLAVLGETIGRQRGCMACHTIEPGVGVEGKGRGPNWAGIAERRVQGVSGGPNDLVDYLAQALYEPGAHLVEGYANIMPAATAAPAKLTYEEIVAVVNYLQTFGGKPSVRIGDIAMPEEGADGPSPARKKAPVSNGPTDPATIFTTSGCIGCHSLEPGVVILGPPLDLDNLKTTASDRGTSTEAYIMESIVSPRAFEKEGFPPIVMPQDFGTRLTAQELEALVNYLLPEGGQQ